jgi:hypothetical protein
MPRITNEQKVQDLSQQAQKNKWQKNAGLRSEAQGENPVPKTIGTGKVS